ncbi:hypothetical protein E2542_SST06091 [Spatholobus suberectus]|nr:hypothetical protein E2542_SST06091 [Spatholobus suberectus]
MIIRSMKNLWVLDPKAAEREFYRRTWPVKVVILEGWWLRMRLLSFLGDHIDLRKATCGDIDISITHPHRKRLSLQSQSKGFRLDHTGSFPACYSGFWWQMGKA